MSSFPVSVYVAGSPADPRQPVDAPPGVLVRRGPALHPDDITMVDGIRVTSPSRTLIDLADELDADELRDCFERARAIGLLDPVALRAARARVEWRPTLSIVDGLIDEFAPDGRA